MKYATLALVITGLMALPAAAQDNQAPVGRADRPNPAVKDPAKNASAQPVAGENSFTMAQAQSAIEKRGYTQVSQLAKDANGIWRGKALRDGKAVSVSVDYQGNVN
jgi:hypothetical protein